MITQLTSCIVGSKLHGLDNEKSDTDIRGVHMHSLKEVLSPFQTLKQTSWIEGDVDNVSYELTDFCKEAIHGNCSILEVLFSNQVIETTPIAEKMRKNWKKFIDTDKFVMASRGYAQNQYVKMQLFESQGEKGQERTAKFAIAYCRVLWQCAEFLKTGEFPCQITDPKLKTLLMKIKPLTVIQLQPYIPTLAETFAMLQKAVTDAQVSTKLKLKPDLPWIEQFLLKAYTS